ncbi:MAG: phage baseplate assembly protein V [Thermodesulfobacteriaceae bacterium]|nr:phage baseplate assembly protein V [Thermodesulfobacteriaceae bacterium]
MQRQLGQGCKLRMQMGWLLFWLTVIHPKTQNNKYYWIPDIGEEVVCAFYETE